MKIWLLASKVFLAGLAVAAAFSVSAGVLRSLKDFKQKMDGIVEGTLRELPQTARDEEVAALERACNRMLSEISLRQAHLVQSEKLASVGTMLAGIAHELNNPLSNISSSCQILLEEFQGGEPTANGASAVAAPDHRYNGGLFSSWKTLEHIRLHQRLNTIAERKYPETNNTVTNE